MALGDPAGVELDEATSPSRGGQGVRRAFPEPRPVLGDRERESRITHP
jgi:hypothetical protein